MGLKDLAVRADHIRDPAGVFVRLRIAGSVEQTDITVGVGDEGEGELVFLGEGTAVGYLVEARADDLRVEILEILVEVPEPGTLFRSPGCVCLGKEPEDDVLSAIVRQP